MTRFWIRVNARLADDAEVRAFARELYPRLSARLCVTAACGLLVALWGRVIDEQEDGDVSGRDDDALEEWARWDGKRGVFAKAFRARFTDDGKIREWDAYQGTLITKREKDRERKRATNSSGKARGVPAESAATSTRNGNENGKALLFSPNSEKREEPAPDVAPAPEGARSPSLNGNYLDSPSAQDELRKRGHRPDPDAPRAPAPTLEENRAAVEVRQRQYDATLSNAASAWLVDHPEDAKALWAECRVEMELPIEGTVSPLKLQSLRAAVVERIRRREGWSTPDAWDGQPFTQTAGAA